MKSFNIYEFIDIIEEADIIYGYVQANAAVRLRARVRKKVLLNQLNDMTTSSQFVDENNGKGKQLNIAYEVGGEVRMTQPVRVYLPATSDDSPFGLSVCDVWDVQITDWDGAIDWIDTEYEVLTGD